MTTDKLLNLVLRIPALLIAFTFHEYAHAIVADKLGDKTPRFQGRLTFNPIAHIDPIGFLMILVAGFGWAKPVQTNPSAFRNYYKDHLKVALAGPIANILVAIVFLPFLIIYYKYIWDVIPNDVIADIIGQIINYIILLNIVLFIFNLLPIPGLDGYHVLADLFPSTFNRISYKIYRYELLILIVFLATPLSDYLVGVPAGFIYSKFINVASLLFG
ncbi:site-2 protease family protein [Clostridium thermarum]|uniref:site-2 protease family protein n=1 Tax=Clostridium thermarum TaxID=1716543 RepID=UPI0013D1BDEE|nr:site-2 protease family protein [Clostridium thermarum]